MTKPRVFEKPIGMRDLLPETVQYKKQLEKKIDSCFRQWGYKEMVTPSLEFFDTVGEASLIEEERLFKLLDRSGNTLVLRPDMTAPIARVVSSVMKEEQLPLRICYHGSVYRAQEKEAGRHAEFFQSGVELIGDDSAESDAEIIALALQCLKETEVNDFRIAIGSMAFVNSYLSDFVKDPKIEHELKQFLLTRDYVSFRDFVRPLDVSQEAKNALVELLHFRGNEEVLIKARNFADSLRTKESLNYLEELHQILRDYGAGQRVQFDLSLVSTISYYSGIIFEGYASNIGFPICSGGRYDGLIEQFGRKAPATGFALKIDRIMEASTLQPIQQEKKILIQYVSSKRAAALAFAAEKRTEEQAVVITENVDEPVTSSQQEKKWDEIVRFGEDDIRV